MGGWPCSGRTSSHVSALLICWRKQAWGPPSAARARGSGAADNPTWQLFTPAWHVPLWSNDFLAVRLLQFHSFVERACHQAGLARNWATGLSLTTPFTEGCPGANVKASPPGRHQEQAPEQRCNFSPTAFSSVQFSPLQTLLPSPPSDDVCAHFGDTTLGQGTFGAWHVLPSISMVESVTCLRCSYTRAFPWAPGYIIRDMVARCRPLDAHGARLCLSV